MQRGKGENFNLGYAISLALHLGGALYAMFGYGGSSSAHLPPQEIYTVTLEGGDRIGGISQVPLDDKKTKVLPNINEPLPQQEQTKLDVKETVPEAPSAIEEQQKVQKQKEEEKKKLEEKKAEEKKLEEKKKLDELEKKKLEQQKNKKEQEKKEKEEKEKEKKARDKKLLDAISKASNYKGESTNAGGQGLGAARLGGQGMGGGTPASIEFIMYRNALEQHIKSGWRWLPSQERYVCQVEFLILPDGTIQSASVASRSGNSSFDEAALRAVYKASPVPVPPQTLYSQFRTVRLTFDSER